MAKKPLALSIVIPVYNEELYIEDCLDAIAAQTDMPDEVLLVDNNSTDATAELAARYAFVTVVREPQQGVLFARDRGFAVARGDVICRIDADTRLAPDWIARVRRLFAKDLELAAVTGDCEFYDFPMKTAFQVVHHFGYYAVQRLIAGTEVLWGSNMAVTKQAWDAVSADCLRQKGVHEDIDLSLHLQDHGFKIARDKQLLATVSLRRGTIDPLSIISYLRQWPATYRANGRYVQAAAISTVLFGIWAVVLPAAALRLASIRLKHLVARFA